MKIRHAAAPAVFVALVFLVIGTFFRVIRADLAPGTLPNFSPLMAAALCGALFIPGLLGLVVPVAVSYTHLTLPTNREV